MESSKAENERPNERLNASAMSEKDMSFYLVILDGTSSGFYEHGASACVFSTYYEARAFVESELRRNAEACGLTEEEEHNACSWDGEYTARFRYGPDVVSDFKIEKMKMPEKGE